MAKRKTSEFHAAMAPYYDMYSAGVKGDVAFYLRECKKAKGKVLEIACGTGRILIPAMKAGVDIAGLDLSREMTDILKAKAQKIGLKPKIVLANMRDFKLKDRFVLIIIPYRSFVHMLSYQDQKKALRNFYNHLKPDGKLVLNVFNPDLARIGKGYYLKHLRGGIKGRFRYWDEGKYDFANQIITGIQMIELLDKKGKVVKSKKAKLVVRYIFPYEFKALLELAGFKKVEICDGFTNKPLKSKTKEMVLIAYK